MLINPQIKNYRAPDITVPRIMLKKVASTLLSMN